MVSTQGSDCVSNSKQAKLKKVSFLNYPLITTETSRDTNLWLKMRGGIFTFFEQNMKI